MSITAQTIVALKSLMTPTVDVVLSQHTVTLQSINTVLEWTRTIQPSASAPVVAGKSLGPNVECLVSGAEMFLGETSLRANFQPYHLGQACGLRPTLRSSCPRCITSMVLFNISISRRSSHVGSQAASVGYDCVCVYVRTSC